MSEALVSPPSCVSGSQSQGQRQKKEQELMKPGSSHGQTPPPDLDKVGFPRALITHIIWEELDYGNSEDEMEVPEESETPIFCRESTIYTAMAAYVEEEEIERKRREAHKEFNGRNNTLKWKIDKHPKNGRWLVLVKHMLRYCEICKQDGDHYTIECPYDNGETSGYVLEELSFLDRECSICLKLGHTVGACPYREYVPKGAQIGPDGILACRCCGKEGGHPGKDDWVGKAFLKR